MASFTYTHLSLDDPTQQIRLVSLDCTASDDEPISCSIHHIDTNAEVSYAALSYAWGEPAPTSSIWLDGQPYRVTRSVRAALEVLRRQGREWDYTTRLLWIDAICIDQSTYHERTQQVQIMSTIYQRAHHVFVWLGQYYERDDNLELQRNIWGFSRVVPGTPAIMQAIFQLLNDLNVTCSSMFGIDQYFQSPRKPTLDYQCWAYLSILFRRPWFERLWVIQELAMARKTVVYCGDCMVEWRVLEHAARAISAHIAAKDISPIGQLPFIYNIYHQNVTIPSLQGVDRTNMLALIYRTRRSKAREPLDRLFAVKGLLQNAEIDIPNPDTDTLIDYSSPPEAAYREWAFKRMHRTKSLDVLTLCTDRYRQQDAKNNGWRSWVPDLRDLTGIDESLFFLGNRINSDPRNTLYAAARATECVPRLIGQTVLTPSRLSIQGISIGRIVKLAPPSRQLGPSVTKEQLTIAMAAWEELVLDHFGWPSEGEPSNSLLSAFVDTIFRGHVAYGEDGNFASFFHRYKVWRGIATISPSFNPRSYEEDRAKDYLGLFETVLALMIGNTNLFITSDNSIGVISSHCHAAVGDEIFVFLGANAPYVVRETPKLLDQCTLHQLLGPCYVNGYMQGRAIDEWERELKALVTIDLI
ncbi:hypothetical protein BP5796_01250 [Coleophoma crateriformis]|uniref:Heterokaryon incompatibility domain-containing protein n=1 Tax=Coleophoma crateriformis TaxID=565419 RepID=A0A3D8SZX7_9HELO|nr:hypothetical protein BP5796_01250 [Coleophoma crateriformis]